MAQNWTWQDSGENVHVIKDGFKGMSPVCKEKEEDNLMDSQREYLPVIF